MKVRIYPSTASGTVKIPPSKSMAHRAIMCACLAEGRSIIHNVSYSDDIRATIGVMSQLGAEIRAEGDCLIIDGAGGVRGYTGGTLDCNESGSTLRFIIPIFSLTGEKVRFTGAKRLIERPQNVYKSIFSDRGLSFEQDEAGITVKGRLSAGMYEVDGNVSSQFISGLMFTLPMLDGDSVIKIRPPFESASYVRLTASMLSKFGVHADISDPLEIRIHGGQRYIAADYQVEGDYSQLAFMAVLGALNGDVVCTGMNPLSMQGDRAVISVLEKAGADIKHLPYGFHIKRSRLEGKDIDLSDCPDLGPILTVLGMYASGATHIFNAGRLRIKESDRISAMEEELLKLGVDIKTGDCDIVIKGGTCYDGGVEVYGHNDHRVVMSLAVAATMCGSPVVINGAEAVNKSYPGFFDDLAGLNIKIEHI